MAAGLTLDEVVVSLALAGQPITRAALSKYELGKSTPSNLLLSQIAQVLNVPVSYFRRVPDITLDWVAFRKKGALTAARQNHIKAELFNLVEGQHWLQNTLTPNLRFNAALRRPVRVLCDAEEAASHLRREWELCNQPIESMTRVIEDQGGIVVGYHDPTYQFDGLSGWLDGSVPVVAINTATSHDRRRYNIAHEMGHLVMDCGSASDREQELFAHRFAAALIVPAAAARSELGEKRRQLHLHELGLLKRKYGLSMQGWIRRAYELEIIDQGHYNTLCFDFSRHGWRKQEPVDFIGEETPAKLHQLTLRAWSEGIITTERAADLCRDCIAELESLLDRP